MPCPGTRRAKGASPSGFPWGQIPLSVGSRVRTPEAPTRRPTSSLAAPAPRGGRRGKAGDRVSSGLFPPWLLSPLQVSGSPLHGLPHPQDSRPRSVPGGEFRAAPDGPLDVSTLGTFKGLSCRLESFQERPVWKAFHSLPFCGGCSAPAERRGGGTWGTSAREAGSAPAGAPGRRGAGGQGRGPRAPPWGVQCRSLVSGPQCAPE